MIPTAMFLVVLSVSIMWTFIVGFIIGRRIERKRHEIRINIFDAYSNDDLARERENTARAVRRNRGSNFYRTTFDRDVTYLANVDKEIARRKVLEQSDISQTMRELAAFDEVFNAIDAAKKEKK